MGQGLMYWIIEVVNGYMCVTNLESKVDAEDYLDTIKIQEFLDGADNMDRHSLNKGEAIIIKGDSVIPLRGGYKL